jgi:hypothetical protein
MFASYPKILRFANSMESTLPAPRHTLLESSVNRGDTIRLPACSGSELAIGIRPTTKCGSPYLDPIANEYISQLAWSSSESLALQRAATSYTSTFRSN